MLRLVSRKVLLLIVLVPALHAFGFFYALRHQTPEPVVFYGEIPPGFVFEYTTPAFWPTYREYMQAAQAGDWGRVQRTPITDYVPRFVGRSLQLTAVALVVTFGLGPLLALLAIGRRTGRISPTALTVFTLGSAFPGFSLGTVLIVFLLLTTRWGWFATLPLPIQGQTTAKHMVLPVLVLATRPVLYVAYVTAGLLEHEFQQDYIRVAKSKGLRWRHLLWRHALPNVAATLLATLGRALQMVIGGLLLVEALFDWRGAGWLLYTVIAGRTDGPNYFNAPTLSLLLAVFGALLIITDLLAALAAHLADPRIRQVVRD